MSSLIPEYTRAGPEDAVLSSSDRQMQLQNLLRADNTMRFEPTELTTGARRYEFNDDICRHCGFLRHQHGENENKTCKTVFDQHGRLGMGWSEVGSAMLNCDDSSNYLHPVYMFQTRRGSVGWMSYVGSRDVDEGIRIEGYVPYDFEKSWALFKERYTIPSVAVGGFHASRSYRKVETSGRFSQPKRLRSPRRSPNRLSPRHRRAL